MRRIVVAAFLAIAIFAGARQPAMGQILVPGGGGGAGGGGAGAAGISALGGYAMGSVAVGAAAPIIGTIVLGRELTLSEVWHLELGIFLGPPGWWLADRMFPPGRGGTPGRAPPGGQQGGGGNISVPPAGATDYVPNEVLAEFRTGVSGPQFTRMMSELQLTERERQTFALTGRTLVRLGTALSARATLLGMRSLGNIVIRAQVNHNFFVAQSRSAPAAPATPPQYVVGKLHLVEAHRVSNGDDVRVAVIDSEIDQNHPDLAGAFAGTYDALGGPAMPHMHGTAMAGAIAAHSKLVGVAPKVSLLAVRAFSGGPASAQGTTFHILKGLDWAAGQNARVVNMSFAGPADVMLRDMLTKAYARGMVLIAAVGNAGPRSPPLYPAAYAQVIGVTATDADDKLLAVANRGAQVALAAPGVDIVEPAPGGTYQVTSGTSIAAAHASGVAALLLARDPKLSPAAVRRALIRSTHKVAGARRDVGAGVIDALAAVNEFGK
jgi:subtilisin family serine protease